MERLYYSINEASARTVHQMMSFSEYKGYVDRTYELADKIAAARPNQADRVYSMAARYALKRIIEKLEEMQEVGYDIG